MTQGARLIAAVRNNAAWCDAVVRANGGAPVFGDVLWENPGRSPRFYPDAITLTPENAAAQLRRLRDLANAKLGQRWGVKDSFAALDLVPLGFEVLFEAQWLHRPARLSVSVPAIEGVEWRPARFLADEIQSLGAWTPDGECIAGAIFNRHENVCGISNFFAPENRRDAYLANIISLAVDYAGPDALVGYETDPAPWMAVGFETLGPLRVWEKT